MINESKNVKVDYNSKEIISNMPVKIKKEDNSLTEKEKVNENKNKNKKQIYPLYT